MPVNGYAVARGRDAQRPKGPPSRPLSEAEQAAVAEKARLLKAHMPEAMDLIKELHAEGLVDGLRCIVSVEVFDEGTGNGAV